VRNVIGQANRRSPCSLTISSAVLLIQLDCGSAHADGANRLTAVEGGWLVGDTRQFGDCKGRHYGSFIAFVRLNTAITCNCDWTTHLIWCNTMRYLAAG